MESVYRLQERTSLTANPSIVHVISVRDGAAGGGWYRQTISIEGMRERALNRWYNHWNRKHYEAFESMLRFDRFDEMNEIVIESTKKHLGSHLTEEQLNEIYPPKTEIHHDSVWDFFNYINYNHKDKKVSNIDTLILIRERNPKRR